MDQWLSMRNLKRSIEVNLQGYKKEKGSCLTATSFFRLVRDQVICTRENFSFYFATAMAKITNRSSICFRPNARMCEDDQKLLMLPTPFLLNVFWIGSPL